MEYLLSENTFKYIRTNPSDTWIMAEASIRGVHDSLLARFGYLRDTAWIPQVDNLFFEGRDEFVSTAERLLGRKDARVLSSMKASGYTTYSQDIHINMDEVDEPNYFAMHMGEEFLHAWGLQKDIEIDFLCASARVRRLLGREVMEGFVHFLAIDSLGFFTKDSSRLPHIAQGKIASRLPLHGVYEKFPEECIDQTFILCRRGNNPKLNEIVDRIFPATADDQFPASRHLYLLAALMEKIVFLKPGSDEFIQANNYIFQILKRFEVDYIDMYSKAGLANWIIQD